MTQHDTPQDQILAAVRARNEARMAAVEELVASRAAIAAKQAEMDALHAVDAQKFSAAVKAGWTEPELKSVGLPAPETRTNGRPPKPAVKASKARGKAGAGKEVPTPEEQAADALTALTEEIGGYDEAPAVGEPVGAGT